MLLSMLIIIGYAQLNMFLFPPQPPDRAVEDREVEQGFTDDGSDVNAMRCYFCHYKFEIDQDKCISCGRCFAACEDTSHQAITCEVDGKRRFEVIDEECVGCNLCVSVCPIDGCITMRQLTDGFDPRTGQPVSNEKANWTTHPNNPMRKTS